MEVRNKLALSREKASELLETISPEKLERIENEKQLPTPEDVMIMAEKYSEPTIKNYYCANQCPMGQHFVPRIEFDDLEKTVLRLVASLNAMNEKKDKLIEIASDGIVHDYELVAFINIQNELEKLSMALSKMEVWTEKMMSSGVIDMEKYKKLRGE
ncbi:MAG: XRE family transcriptional regulator [Mogibacterium sp.]|nr:XRE family transcriptional regulator [Mogibacterium sp.]